LAKSAESIEKKRVELCETAKECKKAQKSAQEFERKELESVVNDEWRVGSVSSELGILGTHPRQFTQERPATAGRQAKDLEYTELGRVYGEWKMVDWGHGIEIDLREKLRGRGVLIASSSRKE
jgi:hypothetical protein